MSIKYHPGASVNWFCPFCVTFEEHQIGAQYEVGTISKKTIVQKMST
jgi:hypothetical protein